MSRCIKEESTDCRPVVILRFCVGVAFACGQGCLAEEAMVLSWPTANPAFARGKPYSAYVQPTSRENPIESGIYGCVRNNGFKFHEGIDLKSIKRDSSNRPLDTVFAAMDGMVVHVNRRAADSSYGNYLVLEHRELKPAVYSLYAHLSSVEAGLALDVKVKAGQPIGRMGNTSGGYRIPLERAHLHFEIGLRLTENFQSWYDRRNFSSPNRHGNFNGMNLVGFDPITFYRAYSEKRIQNPLDYLGSLPKVAVVRVKTSKLPDFVRRYPALSSFGGKGKAPPLWDVTFGPAGTPLHCDPAPEGVKLPLNVRYQVLSYVGAPDCCSQCRRLVIRKGDLLLPSNQLATYLELLFGN
ncbi:MAG: M23 family metallopeptidase [Opitutales bacterium]